MLFFQIESSTLPTTHFSQHQNSFIKREEQKIDAEIERIQSELKVLRKLRREKELELQALNAPDSVAKYEGSKRIEDLNLQDLKLLLEKRLGINNSSPHQESPPIVKKLLGVPTELFEEEEQKEEAVNIDGAAKNNEEVKIEPAEVIVKSIPGGETQPSVRQQKDQLGIKLQELAALNSDAQHTRDFKTYPEKLKVKQEESKIDRETPKANLQISSFYLANPKPTIYESTGSQTKGIHDCFFQAANCFHHMNTQAYYQEEASHHLYGDDLNWLKVKFKNRRVGARLERIRKLAEKTIHAQQLKTSPWCCEFPTKVRTKSQVITGQTSWFYMKGVKKKFKRKLRNCPTRSKQQSYKLDRASKVNDEVRSKLQLYHGITGRTSLLFYLRKYPPSRRKLGCSSCSHFTKSEGLPMAQLSLDSPISVYNRRGKESKGVSLVQLHIAWLKFHTNCPLEFHKQMALQMIAEKHRSASHRMAGAEHRLVIRVSHHLAAGAKSVPLGSSFSIFKIPLHPHTPSLHHMMTQHNPIKVSSSRPSASKVSPSFSLKLLGHQCSKSASFGSG